MKMLKSTTSLALALIMSLIFGITSFASNLCTVNVNGIVEYNKAFECLTILNRERRNAGLNELAMNASLMEVAVTRAFENNLFFSHDRPNGTSCETLQDTSTYYGENIASGYSSAQQVMDGWMNSPEHKANMLSDKYNSIGIACVNGVWVQEFSGRYSQQASKPANCTVVKNISCDASNMYMESPYRYKPASLFVGDRIELLDPKLYLFNQLCYGVDTSSSYDITTSDSSIATVNGLTLTAHNSGTAYVIYTLKGTNISTSVEFSVEGTVEEEKPEPKNISECTFALSKMEYTYSGKECTPTVVVTDGNKTLVKGTDFTVRYESNVNAGCASAYITGIGRYEGTKTLLFDIYPKVIGFDDVKLEYYESIADGTPKKPKFIFSNVNIKEGIDYVTSYKDNVKPGIGIAYYETKNPNFVGWSELYFNINEASSSTNTPSEQHNQIVYYSTDDVTIDLEYRSVRINRRDQKFTPKVLRVTTEDGVVIPASQYKVTYSKNFYAGKAKVTVASESKNFRGSAVTYFDILPFDLSNAKVTLEKDIFEYTGSEIIPDFSIDGFINGDYAYTVKNNVNIGTGKIIIKPSDNTLLTGEKIVTFKIAKNENADWDSFENEIYSFSSENSDDNNSCYKYEIPEVEIVIEPDKLSQTIATAKTSYSKSITDNPFFVYASAETALTYKTSNSKVVTVNSNGKITIKGVGRATITLTAIETDDYEKAVKKVFVTVKPAKPKIKDLSGKSNSITIHWDKLDDNITGYQIAYKRVGSESYKCKTYKGSSLTKKVLKGFSGGTYYVKMRTYKVVDGKRIYSSWSTVKKINISF